jgi:hypothetical protein
MSDVKERVTHTPGPWESDRGVDDDETRCFVTQAIPGRPKFLIAEIQNGAPGDCLETEVANARLIAAAPDLLAALQNFVECAVTDSECCAICTQDVRRHSEGCAVLVAEYAIEKAEGR